MNLTLDPQTPPADELDPTAGTEPVFGRMPTVVVDGREYTLRRLGLTDAFTLVKIVSREAPALLTRTDLEPAAIGVALFMAIPSAELEIMALLASILRVDAREFRDPERFPITTLPDVIEALAAHPDLEALAKNFERVLASPAFNQWAERFKVRESPTPNASSST